MVCTQPFGHFELTIMRTRLLNSYLILHKNQKPVEKKYIFTTDEKTYCEESMEIQDALTEEAGVELRKKTANGRQAKWPISEPRSSNRLTLAP